MLSAPSASKSLVQHLRSSGSGVSDVGVCSVLQVADERSRVVRMAERKRVGVEFMLSVYAKILL